MAQVFISFVHEEQAVAVAVQHLLEKRLGSETVFLSADEWQIHAGEIWLDRIRQELDEARVVILMLSTRSVARPWVNFEAGAAWLTGKIVIPVCYGGLSPGTLPKPYLRNPRNQPARRWLLPGPLRCSSPRQNQSAPSRLCRLRPG